MFANNTGPGGDQEIDPVSETQTPTRTEPEGEPDPEPEVVPEAETEGAQEAEPVYELSIHGRRRQARNYASMMLLDILGETSSATSPAAKKGGM